MGRDGKVFSTGETYSDLCFEKIPVAAAWRMGWENNRLRMTR